MSIVIYGFGGAPGNLTVSSCISTGTTLTVTFNNTLAVSGPALLPGAYSITGPSTVAVKGVVVSTNQLILTVDDQTTGGSYNLVLPGAGSGFIDSFGNVYQGGPVPFTGVNVPVSVQLARSVDERTLDVIFSEPVLQADATITSKYSVSGGVTVSKAVRLTDRHYRLTTSPQGINTSYTVDISGIRDINGNL